MQGYLPHNKSWVYIYFVKELAQLLILRVSELPLEYYTFVVYFYSRQGF